MKIESLANSIESNITRLFKKFKEKPAVFLSKSDVMCYMYYLLVTDPFLGYSPTITNLAPAISKSKTFLVHAGLEVSIENQNKKVALSVGESQKETELPTWDFPIGIEIQHNVIATPEAMEETAENVEKLASYKRGYLLWLNWDKPINDDCIFKVGKLVAEHENLRFFYVDLFSKPPRSNIQRIL